MLCWTTLTTHSILTWVCEKKYKCTPFHTDAVSASHSECWRKKKLKIVRKIVIFCFLVGIFINRRNLRDAQAQLTWASWIFFSSPVSIFHPLYHFNIQHIYEVNSNLCIYHDICLSHYGRYTHLTRDGKKKHGALQPKFSVNNLFGNNKICWRRSGRAVLRGECLKKVLLHIRFSSVVSAIHKIHKFDSFTPKITQNTCLKWPHIWLLFGIVDALRAIFIRFINIFYYVRQILRRNCSFSVSSFCVVRIFFLLFPLFFLVVVHFYREASLTNFFFFLLSFYLLSSQNFYLKIPAKRGSTTILSDTDEVKAEKKNIDAHMDVDVDVERTNNNKERKYERNWNLVDSHNLFGFVKCWGTKGNIRV